MLCVVMVSSAIIMAKSVAPAGTSTLGLFSKLFWGILGFVSGLITLGIFVWASFDFYFPNWHTVLGFNLTTLNQLHVEFTLLKEITVLIPSSSPFVLRKLPVVAFDVLIFLAWGFCHSFFAQESFHKMVSDNIQVPRAALRMVFYTLNGLTTLLFVALWQRSDHVFWEFPYLTYDQNTLLYVAGFWFFMTANLIHVHRLGTLEFLGVAQLLNSEVRTSGQPELQTSGFYRFVRHPIYTFTLAAYFFVLPRITLDRIVFIAANLLYFYFAIPVEEKKLERLFGPAYHRYRQQVPAIFPFYKWTDPQRQSSSSSSSSTSKSSSSNVPKEGKPALRRGRSQQDQ